MALMDAGSRHATHDVDAATTRTSRITGLAYLAFFVVGILGTYVIRPGLFVDGESAGTLANLVEHEWAARADIALELAIVLTQAVTAALFYGLFRRVNGAGAAALALFGMAGAVAILGSAGMLATAQTVAGDGTVAVAGDAGGTVQLLFVASSNLWTVAGVFFGLWLLPMGWLVLESRWFPPALGWLLVAGGAGYVLSAMATYLLPDAPVVAQLLTLPSVAGELWIMGQMLVVGVRPSGAVTAPSVTA